MESTVSRSPCCGRWRGARARLALIHFDAHVDTWPDNFGQPYAHGSVFYHAIEEHLVDPHRMIQIGIRSPVQRDVFDWTVARGVTIVSSEEVHERGPKVVAEHIRIDRRRGAQLSQLRHRFAGPGFCAGHRHARNRRTGVVAGTIDPPASLKGLHFAGMDVVEVAPAYDVAEITSLAAATVAWQYLSLTAPQD